MIHFAIQDILILPPLVHFPRFWTLRGLLHTCKTDSGDPQVDAYSFLLEFFILNLSTVAILLCLVCRWCAHFPSS
jgi:hypothetical protein